MKNSLSAGASPKSEQDRDDNLDLPNALLFSRSYDSQWSLRSDAVVCLGLANLLRIFLLRVDGMGESVIISLVGIWNRNTVLR